MDKVHAQQLYDQLRDWQNSLHVAQRLVHEGGSEEEFRECLRAMMVRSTKLITPVAAHLVDLANELNRITESN